jgi:methionyl-tRNA synthetase
MNSTYYVTTPIYYVNDVPHIGHAYTTLAADVLARYYRMKGLKVFFLTGTDEHGQKVQRAAQARGLSPKELADQNAQHFRALWTKMNISCNDFIRTTEPRHLKAVTYLLERMIAAGDVYLGEYEDWYCVHDETFYTESQLQDGRCPMCNRPVERVKEPSYFFRLSKYQDRLIQHIESHPEFVQPEIRWNEIMSFVKTGLRDLSISRTTFDWGVPIPEAPGHVTYVWVDALTNYISGLGYPKDSSGKYQTFWPARVHLIGKDILRHHAVYWPCFLFSAGIPLPKTIFAHGWWTNEGEKMSKSLGNFVDPHQIIDTYGLDPFRYFLLREVPFGMDGDFSIAALRGRINADLANDLGNLLSRTAGMMDKYLDGKVSSPGSAEDLDMDLRAEAEKTFTEVDNAFSIFAFNRALPFILEFINRANRYIDKSAPWALFKDSSKKDRLKTVLYHATEALRLIAILIYPFMPDSAEEMWARLGQEEKITARPMDQSSKWGGLKSGTIIKKGPALFPRLRDD